MSELPDWLCAPRPSGSAGERRARAALRAWLDARGIAYRAEPFRIYPYSNELIGLWLLGCALALPLSAWQGWPWWALLALAAAIGLVIATVVTGLPLVIWPIPGRGENLLIELGPPDAERELIISAHYDSKTELFDHVLNGRLFRHLPQAIGLSALALLVALLAGALPPPWAGWGRLAALALSLPPSLLVALVGLNLLPGRLIRQSEGAVDNGAACAIVLGLAELLAREPGRLRRTRLTLALFGGEEVSMQGSRAYVRARAWARPAAAVNLELLGQRGPYVLWGSEGNVLVSAPTDAALSAAVAQVVAQVAGAAPLRVGGINSDGYSFVRAGIPTCVLGSYDAQQGGGGLHRPTDRRERVDLARLPQGVAILERLVWWYDGAREGGDGAPGERHG